MATAWKLITSIKMTFLHIIFPFISLIFVIELSLNIKDSVDDGSMIIMMWL